MLKYIPTNTPRQSTVASKNSREKTEIIVHKETIPTTTITAAFLVDTLEGNSLFFAIATMLFAIGIIALPKDIKAEIKIANIIKKLCSMLKPCDIITQEAETKTQ